jgi:hypothetical protein
MLRVAVPLAVLVLLAGCLGAKDDPVAPAAAGPQAQASGNGASATASLSAVNDTPPAPPVPVVTPVSYAGRTSAGACVFIPNVCEFPQPGTEDYHMLDVAGQAQRLVMTLTYGQQVPGMEFYVSVCASETEGEACFEYQTGPSPLAVEFDLSGYPPGAAFGISVGSLNAAGAGAGVGIVFGPADFSVEGALTSLPAAAPAPTA